MSFWLPWQHMFVCELSFYGQYNVNCGSSGGHHTGCRKTECFHSSEQSNSPSETGLSWLQYNYDIGTCCGYWLVFTVTNSTNCALHPSPWSQQSADCSDQSQPAVMVLLLVPWTSNYAAQLTEISSDQQLHSAAGVSASYEKIIFIITVRTHKRPRYCNCKL